MKKTLRLAALANAIMVIEKFLKVNSVDPKANELKERLAALQAKQTAPAPQQPQQSPPSQLPPVAVQSTPRLETEVADLKKLTVDEQRRAIQQKEPEIRLKEERTLALVMTQLQEMTNLISEQAKKIRDLEGKNAQQEKNLESFKDKHEELIQKMTGIDSRLEKFMGLYELVTNQYNPFAQPHTPAAIAPPVPAPAQATPAAPPQTAPKQPQQFAVEDSLTNTKETVIVHEADARVASAQFKRVEELLSQLQKDHSTAQPTATPQPVPQLVTSELHSLLAGFEERLAKTVDQSIGAQLHTKLAALEVKLQSEIRDALRDEISAVQQDDHEVQAALAELQALIQAREGDNRETAEAELAQMQAELRAVRDNIRTIPPNMYFRLSNGHILKDLTDLRDSLEHMPPDVFASHVNEQRNDFATWVTHALAMPTLGQLLRETSTPQDMRERIVAHDGLDD